MRYKKRLNSFYNQLLEIINHIENAGLNKKMLKFSGKKYDVIFYLKPNFKRQKEKEKLNKYYSDNKFKISSKSSGDSIFNEQIKSRFSSNESKKDIQEINFQLNNTIKNEFLFNEKIN